MENFSDQIHRGGSLLVALFASPFDQSKWSRWLCNSANVLLNGMFKSREIKSDMDIIFLRRSAIILIVKLFLYPFLCCCVVACSIYLGSGRLSFLAIRVFLYYKVT